MVKILIFQNKNCTLPALSCLDFWSFGFRDCLGFNIINISFYNAMRYQQQANLSSIVVLGFKGKVGLRNNANVSRLGSEFDLFVQAGNFRMPANI